MFLMVLPDLKRNGGKRFFNEMKRPLPKTIKEGGDERPGIEDFDLT